jgi:hypothetical protein
MTLQHFIAILFLLYNPFVDSTGISKGLIGYDCADDTVNVTSFSLLDVEPCLIMDQNITTEETRIQVIQLKQYSEVHVFQCKVILERDIKHCGMHSHTSEVRGSYKYIVKDYTHEECKKIHDYGIVSLSHDTHIRELKRNTTTRGSHIVVGDLEGSICNGGTYHDNENTYKNVLVSYKYEISLYDYTAHVKSDFDKITLRNGLSCTFSLGKCLDSEEGFSSWDTNLKSECSTDKYSVIYDGMANKTYSNLGLIKPSHVLYSAINENHIFSIQVKQEVLVCGHKGYSSDHKHIFIVEVMGSKGIFDNFQSDPKNLDLFTYFNSKITIIEHHIQQQISSLYQSLLVDICKVEKSLLETRIILARINPSEFASNLMKSSGYTAVIAGEVIYIIQCKPVYVTLRSDDKCYQEIPVVYSSVDMYLGSVTRIIQRHATEIECTPLLPAKFMFGGKWYSMDGRLREVVGPNTISSDISQNWTYEYLPSLMSTGLYDSKNVDKMHDMIYENDDRRSASVVVHRTLAGSSTNDQGFNFGNIMSETVIETTIAKYWHKVMSWTNYVGNLTSSVLGLWVIGKLIKFLIDTVVHGQILYDIYGLSWKLLASMWDSLTSLLSHRYHHRQDEFTPIPIHNPAPQAPVDPNIDNGINGLYPPINNIRGENHINHDLQHPPNLPFLNVARNIRYDP